LTLTNQNWQREGDQPNLNHLSKEIPGDHSKFRFMGQSEVMGKGENRNVKIDTIHGMVSPQIFQQFSLMKCDDI
jgi:hypothetical protein